MKKIVEDPTGIISLEQVKAGSDLVFGKVTKYAKKKCDGREGVAEIIVELFLPQSAMQSGSGYSLIRSFRSSNSMHKPILSHFITTRADVLGYHISAEKTSVDEVGRSVVACYCFTYATEAFDWFVSERAKSDFIRYVKE